MHLVRLSIPLPVSLQLNLFSKMYHVVQLECRRSGVDSSQGTIYYKCSACYMQHVEHIFKICNMFHPGYSAILKNIIIFG